MKERNKNMDFSQARLLDINQLCQYIGIGKKKIMPEKLQEKQMPYADLENPLDMNEKGWIDTLIHS